MGLRGFNLLKAQKAPPTVWEKIYGWVLGTARVIVIFVEIIVVGVFAARIALDTVSGRLDDDIEKSRSSVAAYAQQEAVFRRTQSKIAEYEEVWNNSSNYADMFFELENYLGANFSDLRIDVNKNTLTVRAEGDVTKISELEEVMKTSPSFKNVEIYDLKSEAEGSRRSSFGIRAIIVDYNVRELDVDGT